MDLQTEELQVFDETDGAEIEDDEVLLSYDKIFNICNISEDTGLEPEADNMLDFNRKEDLDFETKLESEAGKISDCEKEGDFAVGNISEDNGLKPEVGSLSEFKGKEDLDFDTKLESEAGSMETMERKKTPVVKNGD